MSEPADRPRILQIDEPPANGEALCRPIANVNVDSLLCPYVICASGQIPPPPGTTVSRFHAIVVPDKNAIPSTPKAGAVTSNPIDGDKFNFAQVPNAQCGNDADTNKLPWNTFMVWAELATDPVYYIPESNFFRGRCSNKTNCEHHLSQRQG